MLKTPATVIGPYRVGEIPETLSVQFTDAAGAALSTPSWSAKGEMKRWGSDTVTALTATVNATGRADVVLPAFTDAGDYELEVWIYLGTTSKLSSRRYAFLVMSALAVPT